MKKLFLLFILCITTIATKAQSGDAKGEWSGQLNVFGQKLTLVFLLNDENCTLDSPDQGVKGVPAKLERTETGIKVSVPNRFSDISIMSLPMTISGRLVFYRVSHMNVTVPGLQTIFLHILGYSRELPFDTLTLLAIHKGK